MTHSLRQALVDKRPDATDPDNWPADLATLAGRLLAGLEILDALRAVNARTGAPTAALAEAAQAIHDAREALAAVEAISPLRAWVLLHPPEYHPLDGIYDCGNPDCPTAGFRDRADRDLHYRRWRL